MAVRLLRTLLALLGFAACAHALVDDALDVIRLGKEIGEEVLSSWDLIGKPFNASGGVELPIIRRKERVILARLAEVTRAIQRLELGVEKTAAVAELLAKSGGRGARLELRLHEMADLLSRVASADRQMREYVKLQQELERSTLEDFAEWCVSHDPSALPGLLERVHALVVPPHHHLLGRGLLQLVLDDLQEGHPDLCELQMSPHQLIYDMYNTISLTEIKGYAMMQFSWMLLKIYGKGNFTEEASLTRQRYAERSSRTAAAARSAMAMARRGLYRCDPVQHKEGETYAQVTRLLQGYIENEVDMNADGTCRDNCAYYTLATRHGCFKEQFCAKQTVCNGRIIDCQYIDSDMWVCPAGRNSIRRYEWIEYENGRTLGKVGSCTRGTTKVDSWWRWSLHHCSYCMCLCEDEVGSAERFFSMREAVADIQKQKVVTGVRLIKSGRVFHLQISEGLLGERGSVTPGEWVPVAKFDPSDPGVREGLDYHTLTYEQRAIDLDELDSPLGHILTGVRFSMIGAHLHFEIRSTPFNYTTGRLSPDRSQWISNDNTEGAELPRSRLDLYKPDIPTRSLTPLPVDSKHDQYVEFVNSDFEADAAQSTVPFVDIQPVIPMKGAALASGAGLIHRGARGSGGYIAVKLFTYDFSRHVRADPPPNPDENTTEFLPLMIN
ncbi:chemokine-like protein orion isoform X2 [Choristoneura fumiferana]|uniref:chemokine-like protein orion isoform X2 n=1 Tax=Choristoneura fumiferana TaxID=7141 RepID=UPI003D15C2E2